MPNQTPRTPSQQVLELVDRIQAHLDAPRTHEEFPPSGEHDAQALLREAAGKLRGIAQVIDTEAHHFAAGSTDETVAEIILDEPLNHDTQAAVLSFIESGMEHGNAGVVNLVRQIPPHGVQQMLMWLLLQSVHANHQARAQSREVLGAHCTDCNAEWDKDELDQARLHSAGLNHHIEPIRGL